MINLILLLSLLPSLATLGVDEVKPGMKGIGRTVFKGSKIEEFGVEILGVLKGVAVGGDLILARLEGGPLEETGVIAGMSGSPVYLDGKLIGALSYAWGFQKEPIAGITPIDEMLKIPSGRGLGSISHTPLHHLPLPIAMSGAVDDLSPALDFFEGLGMVPVPGSAPLEDSGFILEPGAAVGVKLIEGDLDLTAIGTLTYLSGDTVLAFGHPFFQAGQVDYPLCGAWVHTVMPSQASSFKLSSPSIPLGRITQDRAAGIAGILGEPPELIPLIIKVKTSSEKHSYNFRVVDHQVLTPRLMGFALLNTILVAQPTLGPQTIKLQNLLRLTDGKELKWSDLYSGPRASYEAGAELQTGLGQLLDNPFSLLKLQSVEVELSIIDGEQSAQILGVRPIKPEVAPGETLRLSVKLKPHLNEFEVKEFELPIPVGIPEGELLLVVGAADSAQAVKAQLMPDLFKPHSLEQLFKLIQDRPAQNELAVIGFSARPGLVMKGAALPSLPGSFREVIRYGGGTEPAEADWSEFVDLRVETPYRILGIQTLRVEVKRR
jgi:hypothetical protein